MEHETPGGPVNMSTAELLRAVVAEKLTTAAQEILAVVGRTVAAYEEEASVFRRELDRQRRQLEALLQPRVKLETTDDQQMFPVCEPVQQEASAGAGGPAEGEEEEQHKYELIVEDGSEGPLCYAEEPEQTSTEEREPLAEPDHETPPRILTPTVRSSRRSPGKPRESQSHVDLRVCVLEDSHISVLSSSLFQKYPLQELRCPGGLGEADFLDLLRSTFPQLAAHQPFDALTTDKTKKLQPLKVKALTPEEIYRAIRSSGHSALYLRLKAQEEPPATDEESHPVEREDAAGSPSTPDQSDGTMGRRRTGYKKRYRRLKIRILEDSQINFLSTRVFQKYPLQELQCPGGLGEADFLDLLRSTFPQLAAHQPFDALTTDKSKKLQPLKVKALTPEEIYRAIRSSGHSALYLRLKPPEELKPREKDPPLQTPDAAAETPPSSPPQAMKMDRSRISDENTHRRLNIRILEDSQINVLSNGVFQKYPLQELQCPDGLGEADFLDLLRSTFPQLAAHQPFDALTTDRSKKLQPLKVKALTPEEIYRAIRSSGHSALYLRLKAQDEAPAGVEKLHVLERNADAAQDCPSTSDQGRLHMSSPAQRERGDSVNSLSAGGSAARRWERSASASTGLGRLLPSDSEREDDDWKPETGDEDLRTTRRRRAERSDVLAKRRRTSSPSPGNSGSPLRCKVCGVARRSKGKMVKHSWTHVDDPRRLCGACGRRSGSAEELRRHLQGHHQTLGCHVCGMYFLSAAGLSGHVARHEGGEPRAAAAQHACKVCGKEFDTREKLRSHVRGHARRSEPSVKAAGRKNP